MSFSVMATNAGIVAAFMIGTFFDFYAMPKFVIALTIVFVILCSFFPESPIFLIKRNKLSVCHLSIHTKRYHD